MTLAADYGVIFEVRGWRDITVLFMLWEHEHVDDKNKHLGGLNWSLTMLSCLKSNKKKGSEP